MDLDLEIPEPSMDDNSDIDYLLSDSPSPGGDMCDSPTPSSVCEDDDDDDIEILNESQTALFAKIFKTVHKVEPKVKIKEQEAEEEAVDSQPMSQSLLLDDVEEYVDPDTELVQALVSSIPGADYNIVSNCVRKERQGGEQGLQGALSLEEQARVGARVREELEEATVKRVAKNLGYSERFVKICMTEVKEKEPGVAVTEEELGKIVEEMKAQEEMCKDIQAENPTFTKEMIKDSTEKLSGQEKKKVVEKIIVREKSKNLAEAFNVSIDFAQGKLEESGMDECVASQAILEDKEGVDQEHQKNVRHLSEVFQVSDVLIVIDNVPQVSEERAKIFLQSAENNLEAASSALAEDQEREGEARRKEEQDRRRKEKVERRLEEDDRRLEELQRDDSKSPELEEPSEEPEDLDTEAPYQEDYEDDIDGLLAGMDSDDEPLVTQSKSPEPVASVRSSTSASSVKASEPSVKSTESAASSKSSEPVRASSVLKPSEAEKKAASYKSQVAPLPSSRPQLISAPVMPHRRTFNR